MKRHIRNNKPNINIYSVPCSIPQLAGVSGTDGTFLSVPICYISPGGGVRWRGGGVSWVDWGASIHLSCR